MCCCWVSAADEDFSSKLANSSLSITCALPSCHEKQTNQQTINVEGRWHVQKLYINSLNGNRAILLVFCSPGKCSTTTGERSTACYQGFHSCSFCREHRSWFLQNLWGYRWWWCLWVPFPLLCHYICYPTCHLWVRKTLFSGGRAVISKSLLRITWDWHAQAAAAVRRQTKTQCDAVWRNEVRDASQECCFMWIVIKVWRRTLHETGAKKSHERKHFIQGIGLQVNCHAVQLRKNATSIWSLCMRLHIPSTFLNDI